MAAAAGKTEKVQGNTERNLRNAMHTRGQPTLICVHGMACNALEVQATERGGSCTLSFCSILRIAFHTNQVIEELRLELGDMRLDDGTYTKTTTTPEGRPHLQPMEGTRGFRCLNSGENAPAVAVWSTFIDTLEDDVNLHAFNYDWRRWGDYSYCKECVHKFQEVVQNSLQKDGNEKATLIGHSMGCCVIIFCLNVLGAHWTAQHVSSVILVGAALPGAPTMLACYGGNPIMSFQSWLNEHFAPSLLADVAATWACMPAEMPVRVGGIDPYPEGFVFGKTPTKEYRIDDMGEFLKDLAAANDKRTFGEHLWPSVQRLGMHLMPPPVPVHFIYSSGVDTPAQVEYDSEDLSQLPKLSQEAPGDGVITAAPLKSLAHQWRAAGHIVSLLEAPGAASHAGLISNEYTIDLTKALLSKTSVKVVTVDLIGAEDLPNEDWLSFSDPYVQFWIPEKEDKSLRTTPVVQDNLNPVFDYKASLFCYEDGDAISFRVMDADTLRDTTLGVATLKASKVERGFKGKIKLSGGGFLIVKVLGKEVVTGADSDNSWFDTADRGLEDMEIDDGGNP